MFFALKGYLHIENIEGYTFTQNLRESLVEFDDELIKKALNQTIINLQEIENVETIQINISSKIDEDIIYGIKINYKKSNSSEFYFPDIIDRDLAFAELYGELKKPKEPVFNLLSKDWRKNN